jgi:hypothetical protein
MSVYKILNTFWERERERERGVGKKKRERWCSQESEKGVKHAKFLVFYTLWTERLSLAKREMHQNFIWGFEKDRERKLVGKSQEERRQRKYVIIIALWFLQFGVVCICASFHPSLLVSWLVGNVKLSKYCNFFVCSVVFWVNLLCRF